jgi:hypothetical protein
MERLDSEKQSSLLCPFIGYKEIEVLSIWLQGPYSQHYIFFATYKWTQEAGALHHARLERLGSEEQSSLLCPFTGNKEIEVLLIWS